MSEANPIKQVCFIGLGVMGFPMAGHLATKGYQVTVYNRTVSKCEQWVNRYPGKFIRKIKDAARSQVIVSCIGNDRDLESVFLGEDGLLAELPKGTIVIDHTTASAEMAQRLFEAARERGVGFIDAPVSGGEQGAINGQLTIMCGGEPADYQRAEPLMGCYAKASRLMGATGSGQRTKMVNQIAICGLIQSLAEAIRFSEQCGLDTRAVIDVISKGAAQSWQMENRHETMLTGNYNHGFAVDLMRKDLGIVLDEARKLGTALPVTGLIDQFYAEVQAMGGGRWDTSSLLARLAHFDSGKDS